MAALNGAVKSLATPRLSWNSIPCSLNELNLNVNLSCGQSFRWKPSSEGQWTGVIGRNVYTVQQTDASLLYYVHTAHGSAVVRNEPKEPAGVCKYETASPEDTMTAAPLSKKRRVKSEPLSLTGLAKDETVDHASILNDYFRLSVDLKALYSDWAAKDSNFAKKAASFMGVRMLRQEPVETLFSFICSSNNNISRITGMVESLCQQFGDELATYGGHTFYAFPPVARLAKQDVEGTLRTLGFGYRAKYISQTAQSLVRRHGAAGAESWLLGLRSLPYDQVISELTHLSGVGRKVADCVALMSLDKLDAVPVDTHVFQIAVRDYSIPDIKAPKTVTDRVYAKIGHYFRELFGAKAGWAHTVLFSADLKKFKVPPS